MNGDTDVNSITVATYSCTGLYMQMLMFDNEVLDVYRRDNALFPKEPIIHLRKCTYTSY